LTGTASTIPITGLDGDRDWMYYFSCNVKNAYNGAALFALTLNSYTTATDYGYQRFYGQHTTMASARNTNALPQVGYSSALNYYNAANGFIFAKTGTPRAMIFNTARDINGTTIDLALYSAMALGNTAANITQAVLVSDQATHLRQARHSRCTH